MNLFNGPPVEADGTGTQSVPPLCALLLPVLRTHVGVRYSSDVRAVGEALGCAAYYSGRPRLTAFPPEGWVDRLIGLEATRPRLAWLLARLLYLPHHARSRLARGPVWVVKGVAEPLVLVGVGTAALLATWLVGLPLLFVGLHAVAAATLLANDQFIRSMRLYRELRENEEGAIVAIRQAERLSERRDR